MAENRDHLIDIGDPEEDAPAPAGAPPGAPHVVIEYRDRGLPWMLLLPLLVAAAAMSVVGYKAFDRTVRPGLLVPFDPIPAPADPVTPAPVPAQASAADPVPTQPGPEAPRDEPGPKTPFLADMPPPAPTATPTMPEVVAHAEPAPAEPPAAAPAPAAEAPPPALPKAQEFGLMAELERAEVKPAEPAPATALAPPAAPPAAEPEQPRGPDARLLPPDPVLGAQERRRRFLAEIQRQNAARVRFHAELKATLARFKGNDKNFREIIEELCRRYGTEPAPAAREMAEFKLTRQAAGVAGGVRVAILRELGWPEAAILRDLVAVRGRHEDGTARGGPRSYEDVLRQCSLELLRYPPKPAGPPAARAVNTGPRTSPR